MKQTQKSKNKVSGFSCFYFISSSLKRLFSSRKFSIFFVLAIFSLIYPFASALAQNVGGNGGIVPCGGTGDPCTLCHLIVGVSNLVNWGKNILLTAALTGITISGVIYIVSSGDPGMTNKAKSFLQASITGFAIVLSAWLMVNVTLWILSAKSDLGIGMTSWNKFTCSTVSSTGGMPSGSGNPGGSGAPGNSTGSVGCGKIVDAARQMKDAGCNYCNTFSNPSQHTSSRTHGPDSCNLNACGGNPGFTDCSNFTNTAYQKASCSQPGGNAASMQSKGEPIGDKSSLKAGDALANNHHVVMCENDGCATIIHASGTEKGLVSGAPNYMINDASVRVIRASKYCSSCN